MTPSAFGISPEGGEIIVSFIRFIELNFLTISQVLGLDSCLLVLAS